MKVQTFRAAEGPKHVEAHQQATAYLTMVKRRKTLQKGVSGGSDAVP
jgi:hypothetical protein